MLVGYAHVSKNDQSQIFDSQKNTLLASSTILFMKDLPTGNVMIYLSSISATMKKRRGEFMNSANQRPTLPLSHTMTKKYDRPALFKAQNKSSNQEVYFDTSQEAHAWMATHQDWILKKRENVKWTFPLEKIINQPCWVKMA